MIVKLVGDNGFVVINVCDIAMVIKREGEEGIIIETASDSHLGTRRFAVEEKDFFELIKSDARILCEGDRNRIEEIIVRGGRIDG